MVEVKGSRHKPKVPKSITGRLGDLYVTGFVINQCMRSLKKLRELIRDVLRTEPLTPVVLLEQLPSCSFACKRKHTINRKLKILSSQKLIPTLYLFSIMQINKFVPAWVLPHSALIFVDVCVINSRAE